MADQIQVADFFQSDYPSYGSYDNIRKIASYIDGMKISMRKIIFTLMEKYPSREKVKTETVANVTAAHTNYLHGAGNLCGVCNTLAQGFVGANNYPLIVGNSGGFGTRINPTCAAPRYTKIAISDLMSTLLNDNDFNVLERQFFEGDYIEPKYFVPVFPVLFLNGSSGMSTGFSHDILPRNPEEIISYIQKRLAGTAKPKMSLLPWFRGHLGKVSYNQELDRVESFGVITKNSSTSYTITELPIGTEYSKYIEQLDKLCENGTIVDYDDKCDPKTDSILFDIKTTREFTKTAEADATGRKLYEALKMIKSLSETLCCIDENNRVREFDSVTDILDAFIDLRLKYYDKRKVYILDTLHNNLIKTYSKYLFIKGIIDKSITINNTPKAQIIEQLEKVDKIVKIDDSYDYLLKIPVSSLTKEEVEKLKNQINSLKEEYKTVKNTSINDMWLTDLAKLKKVL